MSICEQRWGQKDAFLQRYHIERGDNANDFARVAGDMRRVCAPMHKYANQAVEEAIAEGSMPAKKKRGKNIARLRRSKRRR